MIKTAKDMLALTAYDLMNPGVITIAQDTSLRAAAQLLFEKQIGGAPVVDAKGQYIGMLTARDIVHWVKEGARGAEDVPFPSCHYQVKGRLLTGDEATICTAELGSCPLQETRATTGGRHTAICRLRGGVVRDWQDVVKELPDSAVRRYMTSDFVTVGLRAPLTELARTMVDAHVHRLVVVDRQHRPIGIVSCTDVLAVVAHADCQPVWRQLSQAHRHCRGVQRN